jgi:AraC-like DNA-binding protein
MISQASVGESASVVINYYVTFRIKQLLYRGQLSVKQISEMLNFPTQSFFGRYFKRVVGISPRQYMKQNCRNYNE